MSEAKKNDTDRVGRVELNPSWLDLVRHQVGSLRFGTVLITVHDGRVVQVEKNEKLRLDQTPAASSRKDLSEG